MHRIVLSLSLLCVVVLSSRAQWEQVAFPKPQALVVSQTSKGLLVSSRSSLFRSMDNGQSWDSLSSIGIGTSEFLEVGNSLLAVATFARIPEDTFTVPCLWRSEDGGRTWSLVLKSMYGAASIVRLGGTLYTHPDGELYFSADTGRTWRRMPSSEVSPYVVAQLISDGPDLYARIQTQSLFRSSNGGKSWDSLHIGVPGGFYHVVVRGTHVWVGGFDGGFYVSSDRGNTWGTLNDGLPDSSGFRCLSLVGDHLLASVSRSRHQTVYRLGLASTHWEKFDAGLMLDSYAYIFGFTNNESHIFLAAGTSLWRRSLSDLVTDEKEPMTSVPLLCELSQNYPNPFNPSTTIRYGIPARSHVSLAVYNMLGQRVAELVNGEVEAGYHEVRFVADGLPSGVYIYRLQAGGLVEAKKLLLIR